MTDAASPFSDPLNSGGVGPLLAVAPSGRFRMGARPSEDVFAAAADPLDVTIAKPFALGVGAVSFAEFEAFCDATGGRRPDNDFGEASLPAVRLELAQAIDYCAWLSEETGALYRLPSEAEWEYAARAGTDGVYWWGDVWDPACGRADKMAEDAFVDQKPDPSQRFAGPYPTLSLRPNPWGLHNMLGNCFEWCLDDWADSHRGADPTGAPRLGDGRWAVARGGAWALPAKFASCAARSKAMKLDWSPVVGFRVLREL